jgi:uncharacterized protein YjbI with pentapeptide repeats
VQELMERYHNGERDFSGLHLEHAVFSWVTLEGVNFSDSVLPGAVFDGARLTDCCFDRANLTNVRGRDLVIWRCSFKEATLNSGHFNWSLWDDSDLSNVDLTDTFFHQADFGNSDFAKAMLGHVALIDSDVRALCRANETLFHIASSHVDHTTIVRSLLAPNLKDFLLRTGMPPIFVDHTIECARTIDKPMLSPTMRSTFISYGGPDTAFARKLYEALHENGVTAFFFPEHAVPGERLHRMMREGVNQHDRVVLVCSKASLTRPGVLNEIEEALAREAREGGETYLIPIRLDDYVFSGWAPTRPDLAQAIRDRVVADFTGALDDNARFDAALLRLLRALKR